MAKRCTAWLVMGAIFALAGCQATPPASLVTNLPPPNFDGPADLTTPPPQQKPFSRPPVASLPKPSGKFSDIPSDWIPPIRPNAWRWIVIHHSATPTGGAAAFDRIHKAKHWDELGYHFVIGNGTDTRDGQIEVGPRWRKQKWGAHAKTPDNRYNDYGIGICLVGNFDITRPTPKQIESVTKLVAYLQQTYNVPAERVLGHQMVKNFDKGGTSTDCPGKNMNIAQIRALSGKKIAEAGASIPMANTASASASVGAELLVSDHSNR